MGSNDKLKTAKISIAAEDMSSDGYADKHVRKARRKERQKGKNIIKKELEEYGNMNIRDKSYKGQ